MGKVPKTRTSDIEEALEALHRRMSGLGVRPLDIDPDDPQGIAIAWRGRWRGAPYGDGDQPTDALPGSPPRCAAL